MSAPDSLRCFVAVPLDDDLRDSLAPAIRALRAAHPEAAGELRWTEAEGWHLTLAFLGETPRDAVERIAAGLDAVAAVSGGLVLATGGIGAFPSARQARVLWYGVRDPERRLASMATTVRNALGLVDAGPFRPHVTLARSRHRHGGPVTELIAAAEVPGGELTVDRIVLYRSRLSNGPARYETLHEARLSVATPPLPAETSHAPGAEATA